MSWLAEVPKTIDYIIEHPDETLLFLTAFISTDKKGRTVTKITSEETSMLTLGEINDRIRKPIYILVKVNNGKEKKNGAKE